MPIWVEDEEIVMINWGKPQSDAKHSISPCGHGSLTQVWVSNLKDGGHWIVPSRDGDKSFDVSS